MNRWYAVALGALALTVCPPPLQAEPAPEKVVRMAHTTLKAMGSDPVIVAAVKSQNAKGMSLDQIKARDDAWRNTSGLDDFMRTLMSSPCGERLKRLRSESRIYSEIFVMDNQGANVCLSDKTSDYWQGDEAKWQKSFAGGKGAVFVDEVKFDDSSQAYLVQVSVPVMEGDTAIGAITFGIVVDEVE